MAPVERWGLARQRWLTVMHARGRVLEVGARTGSNLGHYPPGVSLVAAEPDAKYQGRSWAFWQFTTTGKVPGVAGRVDRNSFNGTEADWDRVLKWLEASR